MRKIISTIMDTIHDLPKKEQLQMIAIDGRCAAGKTTLAIHLQEVLHCPVIHMDHFFLRPEQRTKKRLSKPGENVDYERFLMEVMVPLQMGKPFAYKPFDCKRQKFAEPISIVPKDKIIIEGSYSCHPALWENYDLRIFLTIDEKEQLQRIKERNGEAALTIFRYKWIPLEERYLSAFRIAEHCDLRFHTSEIFL